jgi:putative transposase
VIIDIYSRYVTGWMVATTETAELAKAFIAETIKAHGVGVHVLTIHADRGTSMTSKPVAILLAELGGTRTHSRPHVSNDNPYSEAAFKTLKYCPAFPSRFGSIQDARAFCDEFFEYYNHHHRHSGIALHTPASVHFGTAIGIQAARGPPSTPPTAPTHSGSATAGRPHQKCRPSPGSTSQPSPTTLRRKADHWSQIA